MSPFAQYLSNVAYAWRAAHPGRVAALTLAISLTGYVLWQLPGMQPHTDATLVTFAWVGAFVCYALALVPRVHPQWTCAWWHARRRDAVALGAIVLFAFAARVWQIGEIPFTLGGDEATQGAEALRVVNGHLRNPLTISWWYSVPTLFFFYNSLTIGWLGATITAQRLPWAVLGTLTLPVVFWLAARLKGVLFGLLVAALVALYHFHIHFSRLGSHQIADPLFVSAALLLFYRARQRGNVLDWVLLGGVCGLSLYAYAGARLTPVLILATVVYLMLYDRPRFAREHWRGLLLALGAFLIVGAPMLQIAYLFPAYFNDRLDTVGIFQNGWLERESANTGESTLTVLLYQLRRAALGFNFYTDRTVWYGLPQPLLDPIFGALFLLGLGYATLRAFVPPADRRLFPMVAWWWGATILGGALTENPPSSMRLVTLTVPVCFFIALALVQIARSARRAVSDVPIKFALVVAVLLFGAISLHTYFVDFTPRRIYGGKRAEAATMMAPLLNELKATHHIYFAGAPFMPMDFPTLPFLVPHTDATELTEPIVAPPPSDFLTLGQGAVFIFVPERAPEVMIVSAAFPQGQLVEIRSPAQSQLLATLFIIPPPGGQSQ